MVLESANPGDKEIEILPGTDFGILGVLCGVFRPSQTVESAAAPTDGGRRVIASEAVMFPIAFPAGNVSARTLRADDIAGISELYPDAGFTQLGSVSGRVLTHATCSVLVARTGE